LVGDYKDGASQERAKKVRMAMNLAVDRKAIIDVSLKGWLKHQLWPVLSTDHGGRQT